MTVRLRPGPRVLEALDATVLRQEFRKTGEQWHGLQDAVYEWIRMNENGSSYTKPNPKTTPFIGRSPAPGLPNLMILAWDMLN